MNMGTMIKVTSPYSWNQYFDQEKHFTVHLYTKSLQDQTPQISSSHSKLLGSFQNNIKKLNNELNDACQYDIIIDDAIQESSVFDFIELLKTGKLIMYSENEINNINCLLSVFGLTASLEVDEEILKSEENFFDEAAINFPENPDSEELKFQESFQEPNNEMPQKTDKPKQNESSIKEEHSLPIVIDKENLSIDMSESIKKANTYLVSKLKISSKEWKCRLCGKYFQQTFQMVKHLLDVHEFSENINETALHIWHSLFYQEKQDGTMEKELRCHFCQKKYRGYSRMKKHLSYIHFRKSIRMKTTTDEQTGMECSICNKKWKSEVKWLDHFFSFHLSMQNLTTEV